MSIQKCDNVTLKTGNRFVIITFNGIKKRYKITLETSDPLSRALIKPNRSSIRIIFTSIGSVFTNSSNCSPRNSKVLLSSTRIISLTNSRGDRFIMLHRDRTNVDHASLWKIMMMDVVGSADGYSICKHLRVESVIRIGIRVEGNIVGTVRGE